MTTITFDTLHLADKLKAAGIPPEQAEAVVRAITEAQTNWLPRPIWITRLPLFEPTWRC